METEKKYSNFGEKGLAPIERIRKSFLLVGIYTFIIGIVLGAVSILVSGNLDIWSYILRVIETLVVVVVVMVIASNCFKRIAHAGKSAQVLATIALVADVLWGIFAVLTIWTLTSCPDEMICYKTNEVLGRITAVSFHLLVAMFFGENAMAIREYDRKSVIRPIKITAAICMIYGFSYFMIKDMLGGEYLKWILHDFMTRMDNLAVFMAVMGIIAWIVVAIISQETRSKIKKELIEARNASGSKKATEK